MAKREIDSFTLKTSQLVGELDRLFMCKLDNWYPINNFELEVISQRIGDQGTEMTIAIQPSSWPKESWISCKFYCNINHIWRLSKFTIKARHIQYSAIGGIDITLKVIDIPGVTVLPSDESGNPAADIINGIIFEKYPTSPQKFCS